MSSVSLCFYFMFIDVGVAKIQKKSTQNTMEIRLQKIIARVAHTGKKRPLVITEANKRCCPIFCP